MLGVLKRAILSLFAVTCLLAQADITDLKIGEAQIFDVQYYYSGTTLNVSNMIAPYASVSPGNFQHPTLTTGQYYAFFNSTTNPGTYGMGVYNSNGTQAYVVHNTGSLSKMGDGVIFYVGGNFFGTVISTSQGYAYGSSASFTNTRTPTSAEITNYIPATSVPLLAGQSATQANAGSSTTTANPTAVTSSIITAVTPTSNNSPNGEGATNAVDGTSSSKYLNFDRANAGFTITLNAGKVINGIKFTTANDYAPRDPTKFTLYGSNNGTTWTEITANQTITLSSSRYTETTLIGINNTNAYVYYFITFNSTKALDLYPNITNCMAAYGGGWLGTENCNSVQIGEVTYYYNSNDTTTSVATGSGTIANPGTAGATSSMNTGPTVVSTSPGTDQVVVTESPGTTVITSSVTRGNTVDVTTYANTRGDRGAKELTIVRTTTVTSTTPVTTVTTQTTPVTVTTVTTPVTITTWSDGTTTSADGTPVTTVTTRNDVTTITNTVDDIQTASSNQNYYTRIDQMDQLATINSRINLSIVSDPLSRNIVKDNRISNRSWDDRDINVYIHGSKSQSNTVDTYNYSIENNTFGAEHRINRSALVGFQYNRIIANLNGIESSSGSLYKEAFAGYGLYVKDDWILKGDIGQSDNRFNTSHGLVLPDLTTINYAKTTGQDIWFAGRVYTPELKGFRPFFGARKERNTRDYAMETGHQLTAVDYSAFSRTYDTTEYGVRYDYAFSKKWAIAGEASQNNQDVNSYYATAMYNAENNSSTIIKLGRQTYSGYSVGSAQIQVRITLNR
jgi:hypothetical protein